MKTKQAGAVAMAALMVAGALLTGCAGGGDQSVPADDVPAVSEPTTRTVLDSNGTEVSIPADVERVAPGIGAFAQVTEMLTQGSGKIAAAAVKQISDDFKSTFPDYAQSNPDNRDASSVEDLVAAEVQVVYGPESLYSDEQRAQLDEAGIAFVALNNIGSVDGMCESILTIGEILGSDEQAVAQRFVDYYRAGLSDAEKRTAGIADADKRGTLQLNMAGGAYTCATKDDISNAYYVAAGARNVAADYTGAKSGQYPTVDAEQIVAWNPSLIVAMNAETKDAVMADPALAEIDAVRNGNVVTCPTGLYLWCVRSGEGALMTPWLGTALYPDLFSDVDMVNVLQDFYQEFYRADLSAGDAETILAGA